MGLEKIKKRVFQIVEIGYTVDTVSRFYDVINLVFVICNVTVGVLMTFEELQAYFPVFKALEAVTVVFFALDFFLRLWTSKYLYPNDRQPKAGLRYIFSFNGIIDWLSFLPYYLPFFFPAGAAAFRIFRLMRFFKLFRINAYYDSLSVVTAVIRNKRQQLLSSSFIIFVMMVASSLCMYSLEHEAQPEVFSNAFSGIWWATSTLLTVGYGDIYPITPMGQVLAIVISFLGVGLVAIPTGIISAGFVEQQARMTRSIEHSMEFALNFIKLKLTRKDSWVGKDIRDLRLPNDVIVAAIQRGDEVIAPKKNVVLRDQDMIILGARDYEGTDDIDLQELVLKEHHPWVGMKIKEINIPRYNLIVGVKRNGRAFIPGPDLVLQAEDTMIIFGREQIADTDVVRI